MCEIPLQLQEVITWKSIYLIVENLKSFEKKVPGQILETES